MSPLPYWPGSKYLLCSVFLGSGLTIAIFFPPVSHNPSERDRHELCGFLSEQDPDQLPLESQVIPGLHLSGLGTW